MAVVKEKENKTLQLPPSLLTKKPHLEGIIWLETLCSFQIARPSWLKASNTMFRKCCDEQKTLSANTKFRNRIWRPRPCNDPISSHLFILNSALSDSHIIHMLVCGIFLSPKPLSFWPQPYSLINCNTAS